MGKDGNGIITPGDVNSRCPGGEPYYTDTDLAAYEGKIVEISEDSDVCYTVTRVGDDEAADGDATVTHCWTTCTKCCDEEAEDC